MLSSLFIFLIMKNYMVITGYHLFQTRKLISVYCVKLPGGGDCQGFLYLDGKDNAQTPVLDRDNGSLLALYYCIGIICNLYAVCI